MPRNRAFSEPEYSAEYSADCSVTLPSDPGQAVGRTHEVTVRSSGCCHCLPRFMRLTFAPESLENLYQTYFRRQRHETLLVLVVFAALFDSYIIVMCAVVYTTDKLASVLVASVGLAADIILYLLCRFGLLPDRISRRVVPYALWVLIAAQIFCYLGLNYARFHQASDTVGWQAFFSFSFFLTLPLRLTPIVLITTVSCGVHTLVLGVTIAQQQQEDIQGAALGRQLGQVFPKKLVSFSTWIDHTRWARNTWAMAAIFILTMADIMDMLSCLPRVSDTGSPTMAPSSSSWSGPDSCLNNPKYYSYIAVLALMATTMLVQVSHMVKLTLMLLITVATGIVNIYSWRDIFDRYDMARFQNYRLYLVPSKFTMTIMIFIMMVSFYYFSRHVEKLARTLFLWKIEVHEQKEKVYEMRRWNEALVTNMLPEHVARHFLGSKKRDEELYSQSYDEIGVMFASIPNFSDFYTEESINNGGIECLRFLNEIISDFDSLLDEPQFRCITKIKTIGSTYMAASGVTPDISNGYACMKKEEQSDRERWQHLADLADFALAMKVTLMNINYQSFNNFMLRIGLNKGGVLAGVIGARKPHYDIWGNTVNVASRMESTGVMGNIQVVEDCYNILKEYGFRFVRRGPIFVKGKGELLTYFLKGRDKQGSFINSSSVTLPHQVVDS
ncbi:adenylate cyclase type 3 [Micropterus dolomieu]|uniref:adenylate cyclase type 3 n=1 Tax=Micropterus dolomieu TaxID=147949 RepID=UPI001E8E2717|nr:adenylate cyclase type 3 [Micropterus dolomieu]